MINLAEISADGEDWEAFARDFLVELGFQVTSPPDRGPDGGKDILIVENLQGSLNSYPFHWLVSCKHNVHGGSAVGVDNEPSILERLKVFKADGFLGFYSTKPSSSLNERLRSLRDNNDIKDYRIFDGRLIENYLTRLGYSKLVLRYLPESYIRLKPLHKVIDDYVPLNCEVCGKDLLMEIHEGGKRHSVIGFVTDFNDTHQKVCHDIYWACKGKCDRIMESKMQHKYGCTTAWEDISDITLPLQFLYFILTSLNALHSGKDVYKPNAFEKFKSFVIALSQKTLREMTEEERKRAQSNINLLNVFGV